MEGAHKSVQLHNIGSMCVTSLPSQISLNQFNSPTVNEIPHIQDIILHKLSFALRSVAEDL